MICDTRKAGNRRSHNSHAGDRLEAGRLPTLALLLHSHSAAVPAAAQPAAVHQAASAPAPRPPPLVGLAARRNRCPSATWHPRCRGSTAQARQEAAGGAPGAAERPGSQRQAAGAVHRWGVVFGLQFQPLLCPWIWFLQPMGILAPFTFVWTVPPTPHTDCCAPDLQPRCWAA